MVDFKSSLRNSIAKLHPLKAAAVILALLLYTGIVKRADPFVFRSALDVRSLTSITGTVASNPAKSASGRFYSMLFNAESVESAAGKAEAAGRIRMLIPAETVEALYPGKLFSLTGEAVPVEEGARLVCKGYTLDSVQSTASPEKDDTLSLPQSSMPVFIAKDTLFSQWKNGLSRIRALFRLYLKRML